MTTAIKAELQAKRAAAVLTSALGEVGYSPMDVVVIGTAHRAYGRYRAPTVAVEISGAAFEFLGGSRWRLRLDGIDLPGSEFELPAGFSAEPYADWALSFYAEA